MASFLDRSTSFEAARETINHLVAILVDEVAREEAKPAPDAQLIEQLEADIARLGQERRCLVPGTPEVDRVCREYGALVRASAIPPELGIKR